MTKILFVCLGNICRSPTAEAVFRGFVEQYGLADSVEIDSAGTAGYHVGESPDDRAQAAARKRGYDMSMLRGRQVAIQDFSEFDFILAMDHANLRDLRRNCPDIHRHKLALFLQYGDRFSEEEVPDPYYGGQEGFDRVLDLIEDASLGLVKSLKATH
ncbi:MAG: low molecular weight phosphotyrosine protein phosphatase [Pseudomonadales bacterium]|nr:low molecular weight phosphotyrosine protein phosphatase [Pseudomonadales bacterium]